MDNKSGFIQRTTQSWVDRRKAFDANFRQRVQDFATLEMRRRGDSAGKISPKTGEWRSGISSAVVSFPIIARAIRSNTATSIATDIQLNFTPGVQHPSKQAGVEVLKNIYKYAEPRYWTEDFETKHADFGQLGGFSAVHIESDSENKQKVGVRSKLKKVLSVKTPQVITCTNCGQNYHPDELGLQNSNQNNIGDYSNDIASMMQDQGMQDDDILKAYQPQYDIPDDQTCLKCQKAGNLYAQNDEEIEFENIPDDPDDVYAHDLRHSQTSPLLIRFDMTAAIGFQYKKSPFFSHHFPVAKNILKAKFKAFAAQIEGYAPSQWSYAVKWYYDLGKPNLSQTANQSFDERLWFAELDCTYFKREFFIGDTYAEAQDVVIGDEKICSINAGETFVEAMERETGEKFNGAMFYFLDEILIGIEVCDYKGWVLIPWRLNATCAIPMGEERLIRLNDQVTNQLSMKNQIELRNSNVPLVFNSKVYEKSDLNRNQAGTSIGTKDDVDENVNPLTAAGYIPAPPENPSNMIWIQFLIDTGKEESGVFDETVGNTDPTNKTLGGQRLSVNRSLTQLGGTQKSKKLGKKEWIIVIGEFWQEFPDEAFQLLTGINEDGITPQDIDDFRNLNLRNEVIINEVAGTDIPKVAPEMLNNYMMAINLGLFMPGSPIPINIRQIIVREVLGLPIDIDNYEEDRRLAAKRVEVIQQIIKEKQAEFGIDSMAFSAASQQPDTAPKQLIVMGQNRFGQAAQVLNPEVLTAIEVNPQTQITPYDSHIVLVEYYNNQLKALQVSRDLNAPLILALQAQIDKHMETAQIVAMQEQAKAGIMANAANTAANPALHPATGQPPPGSQPQQGQRDDYAQ